MFNTPQNQRVQTKIMASYENMINMDRLQQVGQPSVLELPSSIRLGPHLNKVIDGTRFYRVMFPENYDNTPNREKPYNLIPNTRPHRGGMNGCGDYNRSVGYGVGGFVVGAPMNNGRVLPGMAQGQANFNANEDFANEGDGDMKGGFLQFLAPLAMSAVAPLVSRGVSKVADWIGLGQPMEGGSVASSDLTDGVRASMEPLMIPKKDQDLQNLGVKIGGRKKRMVGRKKLSGQGQKANEDVGVKEGGIIPVNTETSKSSANVVYKGGKKNWTSEERKAFGEKMRKAKEAKRGNSQSKPKNPAPEAPKKSGRKKVWTQEERKAFAEKMRRAKEAKRK